MRGYKEGPPGGLQLAAGRSPSLKDVPRQVLIAGDVAQALAHVGRVDGQLLARQIGRVERDLLEELLHHRVQAPGADVLRAGVHLHRDLCDRLHRLRSEPEAYLLRLQELHVLRDQGVPRLGKNADEIVPRQGVEVDADREAALELWDQVRRLGDVERAGRDEEDVVRADDAVLGGDRRALDDRQEVALDALAADVRTVAAFPPGDLVELVEEDDARV